jgi:hypothetical protein
MTHYATMKTRYAALNEEFGYDFAVRKFGKDEVDTLMAEFGTYKSGKRKGLSKGFVVWNSCLKGGWFRTGPHNGDYASGFVETKGVKWVSIVKEWADASDLCYGNETKTYAHWSLSTEKFVADRLVKLETEIPEAEKEAYNSRKRVEGFSDPEAGNKERLGKFYDELLAMNEADIVKADAKLAALKKEKADYLANPKYNKEIK